MTAEPWQPDAIRRGEAPHERGSGVPRLILSIIRHRWLVWELTRRELTDMHAGQSAGIAWLIVHPMLQFCVYAVLFTLVFRVRIGDNGPGDYLIYLFSGLAPWLLTQEILSRSSNTMVSNATIVKKVLFPTEALVAKTVLSAIVVQAILMVVVLLYTVLVRGHVPTSFALLPLLWGLHFLLLWGLALLLATATPYFRDIPELVRIFVTINIYLMPVMYLPSMVPSNLQFILVLNPFSSLIWCYQDLIYQERFANPLAWLALAVFAAGSLLVGSYFFVRLRHHFSNVL